MVVAAALTLSLHKIGILEGTNCISFNNETIHVISALAWVITLYSDSALDLTTTCCFFKLHEIKLPPKYMQEPEINLLSSRSVPQSASVKPIRFMWLALLNSSLNPMVSLMYLSITLQAIQYGSKGHNMNWLSLLIAKDISDLVKVAYCKALIILLYNAGFVNGLPSCFNNLCIVLRGVDTPLHYVVFTFSSKLVLLLW